MTAAERRAALGRARLYLICDIAGLAWAPLDCVDVLQLREKQAWPRRILAAAREAAGDCAAEGVLFVVNDDPRLALEAGADGVHLGQFDMAPSAARRIVGDERLIGRSTHAPQEVDDPDGADYIGVGPVYATPTKPDAPAVGLELVRYAATHASVPFFAIGGIDAENVAAVRAAGAARIAVVRAIGGTPDPPAAARALRAAITREHVA